MNKRKIDYSRSNLGSPSDAKQKPPKKRAANDNFGEPKYSALNGVLTFGRREMGSDGAYYASEQETMYWTAVDGVENSNDN